MLLTAISLVSLIIMYTGTLKLKQQSSEVVVTQLPLTLKLNNLSSKITDSLEALDSFVLTNSDEKRLTRQGIWRDDIFPLFEEIKQHCEQHDGDEYALQLEQLAGLLKQLYTSQWWVEDVSQYIGNQPSLVVYKRDILPLYYRIHSALNGVNGVTEVGQVTNDLRFVVTETHLTLSRTIHQLSEAILTGDLAYLSRFNQGSMEVQKHLDTIRSSAALSSELKTLVDWINDQYAIYKRLANRVLEMRQAADWNRGLYLIETETEALTEDIKKLIITLQNKQVSKLKLEAEEAVEMSRYASIYAVILIAICAIFAALLTFYNSRKIVYQISQLSEAAESIAQGKLDMIEVTYEDELGDLARVFNQMQKTILRRRKKFVRERERLNDIIRVITHDIKSPLININGHTEIICETLNSGETTQTNTKKLAANISEPIEHIVTSTKRIDELIQGILELSNAAHKELVFTNIELKKTIQNLLQINSHRLKTADVILTSIPNVIFSDEFAVKFVLSTMLDNAIKYCDPGRRLTIEIGYKADESQGIACLYVIDNGIGIADADDESVFAIFTQGKSKKSGHGIGLACARSFAERLNGDLTYQHNENGQGVTFNFEFSMNY
ncbi:MAG: hypothetical protein Alis3KO_38840 [Aliiglaciecola sp.]